MDWRKKFIIKADGRQFTSKEAEQIIYDWGNISSGHFEIRWADKINLNNDTGETRNGQELNKAVNELRGLGYNPVNHTPYQE